MPNSSVRWRVLDVYHQPYDEKRPLICLDEASKQLIGETVEPVPAEPGQPELCRYPKSGSEIINRLAVPLRTYS